MSTNVYKAFLDLLPGRPLQSGIVTAASAGVATVELPGGGLLQVRGQTTVGARVFVRDDVIESAAPNLAAVLIEV
jgi:hypothetical protein